MKVYVVTEMIDENGAREFDYSLFSTFEKAKENLFERNEKLYKSCCVEYSLQHTGKYYEYDEKNHNICFEEPSGDGYWLRIEEREIDEIEQDWYEQFVKNTLASLGTLYDRDGNEVEGYELEPTEEQIEKIAQKFSNDGGIDNPIGELSDICIDYIVSELGLST